MYINAKKAIHHGQPISIVRTASKKDGVKSPLPGVILDIKVKEPNTHIVQSSNNRYLR